MYHGIRVTFEIADESSARSFFESMNQPRINENHSVQQKRANEKAKRVTVSRTRLPPPEINIAPQRKAGLWERKNRLSRLYITDKHFFFEMFARNVALLTIPFNPYRIGTMSVTLVTVMGIDQPCRFLISKHC